MKILGDDYLQVKNTSYDDYYSSYEL